VLEFADEKIAILGSTLWSWIENKDLIAVREGMNDYYLIEILSPTTTRDFHRQHVSWLEHELEQRQGWKVIVVTHHLPSLQLIDAKYQRSTMNCAFATDLERSMSPEIVKYWLVVILIHRSM